MTQIQFNKAFNYLLSNPWKYGLSDSKLSGTKYLFFHKLKDYKFETIFKAFDSVINDKDQESFPSLQRILFEVIQNEPIKPTTPRPVRSDKSKNMIKTMFEETRKITESRSTDKKSEIRKMVDRVKEGVSSVP